MSYETKKEIEKALLVGLLVGQETAEEVKASLAELTRLVNTLGYPVIGQLMQKRASTRSTMVLGEGKLKELAEWTGGRGVVAPGFVKKKSKAAQRFAKNQISEEESEINDNDDEENESSSGHEQAGIVIFDCELSPSQLRNLESALGVPVLDRTGVIIEIFSRHARTRAARLQVELARLAYVAPRLRETGGGEDRGGGGVGARGAGETSLELDRRRIRDRMKELRDELEEVDKEQAHRRSRREREVKVALVGYTNAGKSSLMRALTGSEVLVADKLFATLDTTVRVLHPETTPKILVSDTVGFIKKLPHDLVASFKSTLDEALSASLLFYVVDSADPHFRSQLEVTKSVLDEVGANDTPSLLILNKRDQLSPEQTAQLQNEFPEAILISTRNPEDVAQLRLRVIDFFEKSMGDYEVFVPYSQQGVIGDLRANMKVLSEKYDEQGTHFMVRGRMEVLKALQSKFKLGVKKPQS